MNDSKAEKAADSQSCDIDLKENAHEGIQSLRPLPPILQGKSPEELKALEKRLLRKVDMRLLPTMILIYIMNYLDR
jgi:hypothetical protein